MNVRSPLQVKLLCGVVGLLPRTAISLMMTAFTGQRPKSSILVTNANVGLNSRVLPSIGVPEVKRE